MIEPTFIVGFISFMFGFLAGFLTRSFMKDSKSLSDLFAIMILAIWLGSVGFDMADNQYETPYPVHVIMGLSAGYVFGIKADELFKNFKK